MPKMSKAHFEAFARRIREDIECARTRFSEAEQKRTIDAATYAAHLFADISQQSNPLFDRDRFMRACGL